MSQIFESRDGNKITCARCGHVQQTHSSLARITCSNCGYKIARE